jgi:hypothetical protein
VTSSLKLFFYEIACSEKVFFYSQADSFIYCLITSHTYNMYFNDEVETSNQTVTAFCTEKWQCYVCNPSPLEALVASCSATLDTVEAYHKKADNKLPLEGNKGRNKGRKNLGRGRHTVNVDGPLECDEDRALDALFAHTDVRDLVGYLKSSIVPLYELILESDKRLEQSENMESAKSDQDVFKKDLKEKYRKSLCALRNIGRISSGPAKRGRNVTASNANKNNCTVKPKNCGTNSTDVCSSQLDDDSGSVVLETARIVDHENILDSSLSKNVKPSRDDMEAQRQLHRQLLEKDEDDNSSEDDDNDGSRESSSAEDSEESQSSSSDDEYNPTSDRRELHEREESDRKRAVRRTKSRAGLYIILLGL